MVYAAAQLVTLETHVNKVSKIFLSLENFIVIGRIKNNNNVNAVIALFVRSLPSIVSNKVSDSNPGSSEFEYFVFSPKLTQLSTLTRSDD